jgi:hypothetical protein
MRIIKFNESVSKQEVDDLLYDLKDDGYEVESDLFQGFLTITGKIFQIKDRIKFLQDVIDLNLRVTSLGYESINDSLHVYMGKLNGNHYCQFLLKFKDNEVSTNKDVNSFEEFKEYVEKALNLNFYEWDTEVYIPDLDDNQDYQRTSPLLKLDINKTPSTSGNIPAGFTIGFEKGSIEDISISTYRKWLSEIVMTDDEYYSVNLWSVPDSEKAKYQDPELIKSAKSKQFKFDKKGIEAIEKCIEVFRSAIR